MLTSDENHNHKVADLLQENIDWFIMKKKQFYDTIHGAKELYDLLEILRLVQQLLIYQFRSNINIFNSQLPYTVNLRIKNSIKNLLAVWRIRSKTLIHPYVDSSFIDTVATDGRWECHPKLIDSSSTLDEWNGIIISRLGNLHQTVYEIFTHLEPRFLVSYNTSGACHIDIDTRKNISNKMLPAMNFILQQFVTYQQLIDDIYSNLAA